MANAKVKSEGKRGLATQLKEAKTRIEELELKLSDAQLRASAAEADRMSRTFGLFSTLEEDNAAMRKHMREREALLSALGAMAVMVGTMTELMQEAS
ncbi:hypothetical protein UFOVP706_38 [uncultured Caudovirales phage]|uniref:Uncharacterized protein n=1 Tax=uncultured Caudovirales phage TaxID=2100421 RepID=A0A6J5NJB0_9CAUD|nr:hypothetical protein UFOVP706_38 [uncultured Caudovirales phage]